MYSNKQPLTKENIMYSSLRNNEYELNNAIAEIIDNSIEANAKDVYLFLNTEIKNGKSSVTDIIIVDNGDGMTKDQVQKCLTLGESLRENQSSNDKKIGKFGVGLTLGGISIAKRIEVMSTREKVFYSTYLSLEEIESGEMTFIPDVEEYVDINEYTKILEDSSGTIVRLSQCDRLNNNPITGEPRDTSELELDLYNFIGRVYRKFIKSSINFYIGKGKNKINSFDPLFVNNHDVITKDEYERIKDSGVHLDKTIELLHEKKPFIVSDETSHEIDIRLTLLPEKYRSYAGAGNSDTAKKLRITENEGISILRCNREVLYGHVPYLIGKKGQYKSYEIDRFWGLEISFPPELDDYFHVKFIKKGAEPINELKEFIRQIITPQIIYARNEIRRVFRNEKEASIDKLSETLAPLFSENNEIVLELTKEEFDKIVNDLPNSIFNDYKYKAIINTHLEEKKETIEFNLMKYRFSISFAELPEEELYAFDEVDKCLIIVINKKHKYVREIIYQSIDAEINGISGTKLFESQIAALVSPLIVINKMNKSLDKKKFISLYAEVLKDSVF